MHVAARATREFAHCFPHAVEDLVEHAAVLLEVRRAFGRHMVDLLAVRLDHLHVALVLEELQRWVDGARRWRVQSAELLLERANHFVAVTRLLVEQAQDDELHLARLEHLASPASAAPGPSSAASTPCARPAAGSAEGKAWAEAPIVSLVTHKFLRYIVRQHSRYIVR